jgi:hypothetical protein
MKSSEQTTADRKMQILIAQGFIPVGMIHLLAGVSTSQWQRDKVAYRKAGCSPPLRINKVTGRRGYDYKEFRAWQLEVTEIAA